MIGQQGEDAFAGAGDDVRGDQFAQAFHLGLAGIDRRLHGGDVALDEHRDVTAAQLFAGQHFHRGGFQGGVDGLKYGGEALGFDQADGEGRLGFVFHSLLRVLHGGLFEEGIEIGGGLVGRLAGGRWRGITCAITAACMAPAVASAAAVAASTSPREPCNLRHTPGRSLSSVCSTRTPAIFSMASSTTMAGDQPPISINARAPFRRSPVSEVRA
jgi:hypothetical protein